jgi:Sulfotransferase domain
MQKIQTHYQAWLKRWVYKSKGSQLDGRRDRIYRMLTGPLRPLPDFVIIGVQKGGTTSLYHYLVTGSLVLPALTKEVHYFDLNYYKGPNWYRAHFPLSISGLYQSTRAGQKQILGEATPYYLLHPRVPERMARLMPWTKLIIILRNPIDRALSHYHDQVRRKREGLSFEEALKAEPERLQGELEKLMADENYLGLKFREYSYLGRGVYIDQLKRWRAHFHPDQMLVLKSEDLFSNPKVMVDRTTDFLGLPRQAVDAYAPMNPGTYAPMKETTRQQLADYFAPYNQQLYDLLDIDFGWES